LPKSSISHKGHPDRLAYSIDELAEAVGGAGRSKLYAEIRAGKLKAKKLGSRTIVTAPNARAYLDALPDMAAQDEEISRTGELPNTRDARMP
jgi:hypothetical protein